MQEKADETNPVSRPPHQEIVTEDGQELNFYQSTQLAPLHTGNRSPDVSALGITSPIKIINREQKRLERLRMGSSEIDLDEEFR